MPTYVHGKPRDAWKPKPIVPHHHGCQCCGHKYTEHGATCRCPHGPFDTLCVGCYDRSNPCCAKRPKRNKKVRSGGALGGKYE